MLGFGFSFATIGRYLLLFIAILSGLITIWWILIGSKTYFLLGWGRFGREWREWRVLNLIGRMGSGKTLLSMALAYHLHKLYRIESVVTNLPTCDALKTPFQFNNAICIVDEAGTVFDDRFAYKSRELNKQIMGLSTWLRKVGSYTVFPSVQTMDKKLRTGGIRMWRTHNLGQNRLWIYQWEAGEEDDEKRKPGLNFWEGRMYFVNPRYFYGSYCTWFAPGENLTRGMVQQWLMEGGIYRA